MRIAAILFSLYTGASLALGLDSVDYYVITNSNKRVTLFYLKEGPDGGPARAYYGTSGNRLFRFCKLTDDQTMSCARIEGAPITTRYKPYWIPYKSDQQIARDEQQLLKKYLTPRQRLLVLGYSAHLLCIEGCGNGVPKIMFQREHG